MQNWPEVHPLNSPTLPPATTTNCLIMESGDEIFLIDPAANTKKSQAHIDYILEEALGEKSDRKIKIVLTHHHVDHCGDAERLREKFDFEIWAHEINVKQKLIDFELDKLIGRNKYLDDSRNIQIHHTPGHAVGHLCFFDERSKVLIAGDMVASEGTILIHPEEGCMADYLESLGYLINLRPKLVIPAHGEASSPDILSRTLKHRNDRLDQIKRYLDKFPESDSMQIAKELYKDLPKNYIFLAELSVRASMNFLGY